MKPEEQRIAIAKACGWSFKKKPRQNMMSKIPAWHMTTPDGIMRCGKERWYETAYGKESHYQPFQGNLEDYLDDCGVPDYLNDLNAMHEAYRSLRLIQQIEFLNHLFNVVKDTRANNLDDDSVRMVAVNATAAQRAEAFLKTLRLWKPLE